MLVRLKADTTAGRYDSACAASTKTDTIALGGLMIRRTMVIAGWCVALGLVGFAQSGKAVPRPPAQVPGQPPPGESATPDGYAPIPQWLGQTLADGLAGGFSFHFLPDGRIIVGERQGRIKIVSKDGKISEPLGGLPEIFGG